MIVVYINSMADTDNFKVVYKDLDCKLLYNPKKKDVEKVLRNNPKEKVLLFGHGTRCGLFNVDWSGYIIDATNVHLLKDREIIGIWCYAKEFALKHNLKGFFTDMFISNSNESEYSGCGGNDEEDIFNQNELFAERINELIITDTPMSEWVGILNEKADKSLNFVEYNYSRLEYFE